LKDLLAPRLKGQMTTERYTDRDFLRAQIETEYRAWIDPMSA